MHKPVRRAALSLGTFGCIAAGACFATRLTCAAGRQVPTTTTINTNASQPASQHARAQVNSGRMAACPSLCPSLSVLLGVWPGVVGVGLTSTRGLQRRSAPFRHRGQRVCCKVRVDNIMCGMSLDTFVFVHGNSPRCCLFVCVVFVHSAPIYVYVLRVCWFDTDE